MFRACMKGECCPMETSPEIEERHVPIEPPIPRIPILVEVVGATNLLGTQVLNSSPQRRRNSVERNLPDPYCVVSVGDEVVHKTQTASRDADPIWTVKTKSFCIVHIPSPPKKKEKETHSALTEETSQSDNNELSSSSLTEHNCFKVEVFSGKQSLGEVRLAFERVFQFKGDRIEFPLAGEWFSCRTYEQLDEREVPRSMLALRLRRATKEDISFVSNLEQPGLISTAVASARTLHRSLSTVDEPNQVEEATDVDFRRVVTKELFQSYRKKEETTGDTLIRLQPPLVGENGEEPVEWMTKAKIHETALEPSAKWVETGHGKAGTLYLEIIGCDDLPSTDLDGLANPFACVVFENTMVRTKVIFDTVCPRWMPWSTRAFALNITHPGSMVFLGVFDYDCDLVKDYCDPLGRVVINTINFESGCTYLLHYDLIDSNNLDSPRGTITVRLRIAWKHENEAAKLALKAPPRFIINVETEKSWHALHYSTYGAINMDKASLSSIKLYWSEVYQFWGNYCYFLDVALGILLWRGRTIVSLLGYTVNIWFPIQSVFLFTSVAIAYEKPVYAPSIFFYSIAWIMLSLNFCNSRHPYHWHRVKKFESLVMGILTGSSVSRTKTVEANDSYKEFYHYQELDTLKADRMMALLYALMTTGSKAHRIYSGTSITNIADTTEDNSWYFLSEKLYYPHLLLQYICAYGRSFRNFINWNSYASFPRTLNLLMLGTICLIGPFQACASVVGRILIWTCLGPLMKVLDIAFVHRYYKTDEQLLDDIVNGRQDRDYWFLPFFDSIIEHDVFHSMRKSGRIVAERAAKLKDMRERLHGAWSEKVPWIDNSRRASVPLPQSSAKPWKPDDDECKNRQVDWKYSPGRKLVGDMIPRCPGCKSSHRCISDEEKAKKTGDTRESQ